MYRYYLRNCISILICSHDKNFTYKHRLEVEEDKRDVPSKTARRLLPCGKPNTHLHQTRKWIVQSKTHTVLEEAK
jgi:hypothetical protein